MDKKSKIHKAKLAEQMERYKEMAATMKEVAEMGKELTDEDRNLLSVAYKNVVGARRSAWRFLSITAQRGEGDETEQKVVSDYLKTIEKELRDICNEVLKLLDDHLIPGTTTPENKVFYLKMKGDYLRYLSEIQTDCNNKDDVAKAQEAYKEAVDTSKQMEPTNPIRLGLALNFSVFYYEICNNSDEACKLAKTAFDDAQAKLDPTSDECVDAHLIMQLLRDNLTLWTAENQAEEGKTEEGKTGEGKTGEGKK